MRLLFGLMGIAIAATTLGTPAQAQNYPWCAVYGGRSGGGSNCGFTTYAQCMATVSGIGGFCEQNTQYVPPAGGGGHRHRRHRN
jgi:hypothetical protein